MDASLQDRAEQLAREMASQAETGVHKRKQFNGTKPGTMASVAFTTMEQPIDRPARITAMKMMTRMLENQLARFDSTVISRQ